MSRRKRMGLPVAASTTSMISVLAVGRTSVISIAVLM
jgi:hypothetical protein